MLEAAGQSDRHAKETKGAKSIVAAFMVTRLLTTAVQVWLDLAPFPVCVTNLR